MHYILWLRFISCWFWYICAMDCEVVLTFYVFVCVCVFILSQVLCMSCMQWLFCRAAVLTATLLRLQTAAPSEEEEEDLIKEEGAWWIRGKGTRRGQK